MDLLKKVEADAAKTTKTLEDMKAPPFSPLTVEQLDKLKAEVTESVTARTVTFHSTE